MSASKDEFLEPLKNKWFDKGLKKIAYYDGTSRELFLFIYAFQKFCGTKASCGPEKGAECKLARSTAWTRLDNNGNGIVSLAETGKFIQDHLILFYTGDEKALEVGKDEAEALYKHFYPCFIRAFLDAADYGPATKISGTNNRYATKTADGDDYVQFAEFRLLLTYLCIYATIYEAFANVDGGGVGVDVTDDRRVTEAEWTENVASLAGHPLLSLAVSATLPPAKVFKAMDGDGKGKVLLGEFSKYVEDFEFSLGSRWGKLLNAGESEDVVSTGATLKAEYAGGDDEGY